MRKNAYKKWMFEVVKRIKRPTRLGLKPVAVCNYHCPYCAMDLTGTNWRSKGHPNLDTLIDIIDREGDGLISISGGEPMLYPELPELVSYCISKRKLINISTNLSRYRKLPVSWRLVIKATYHPSQVTQERFLQMVRLYESDGHYVNVYEIGSKTLPIGRVKPLMTKPNLVETKDFGPDGKRYDNCYLKP